MPFFLMFVRNAQMPTDLALGTAEPEVPWSTEEWVCYHHEKTIFAYDKVEKQMIQSAERHRRIYDLVTKHALLLPGERVLVRKIDR